MLGWELAVSGGDSCIASAAYRKPNAGWCRKFTIRLGYDATNARCVCSYSATSWILSEPCEGAPGCSEVIVADCAPLEVRELLHDCYFYLKPCKTRRFIAT